MLCQDELVKHADRLMFCPPRVALGRGRKGGMKKEKNEERKKKKRAAPLAGSTKTPSLSGTTAETERARESMTGEEGRD